MRATLRQALQGHYDERAVIGDLFARASREGPTRWLPMDFCRLFAIEDFSARHH